MHSLQPIANLRNDNDTKSRVDQSTDGVLLLHIDNKPDDVESLDLEELRRERDTPRAGNINIKMMVHRGQWDQDYAINIRRKDRVEAIRLSLKPDKKVSGLPRRFGKLVLEALVKSGKYPRLADGGNQRIEFLSFIELPRHRNSFVSLDDGFLRTSCVDDLDVFYGEPISAACVFNVLDRIDPTQERAIPARKPWRYKFYRLGFLRNNRTEDIVSDSTADGNTDHIKADWPLLAWRFNHVDWERQKDLFTTPAYSFGNEYCIGDVYSDTYYNIAYSPFDRYRGPFINARRDRGLKGLKAAIDTYAALSEDQQTKVASGVPFLPWFAFRDISQDKQKYGLSASLNVLRANTPIHIAVRSVNHLEVDDQNPDIVFPRDMRTDVTRNINARDLKQWIRDELRRQTQGETSAKLNTQRQPSSKLSTRPGGFEIELWVMPQIDTDNPAKDKKLYRFSKTGEERAANLADFMSDAFVSRGDTRLYVESHIVRQSGRYVVAGTVCDVDLS